MHCLYPYGAAAVARVTRRSGDRAQALIGLSLRVSRERWRRGDDELNQTLEKANRVSDFLEIAELMCVDALHRTRVVRVPTSAWRARHQRVRRNETMRISAIRRHGGGKVQVRRRLFIRNRSRSSMYPFHKGVTNSHDFTLRIWRQQNANASGRFRHLSSEGRDTGHVIP